jgi:catechol 2,3-dioxygenase-like lactoylglutathione lyase family enzyme
MDVVKVSSVYYVVGDMDRALGLFRDTLGLKLKFQDGDKWAQFDVNGTQVAVATPAPGQVPPGGGATLVLEVKDLDAARAELADKGLRPSDIVSMGSHGRFFTVKDADGNPLQFFARQ